MNNKGKMIAAIVVVATILIFIVAFVAIDKLNYKPFNEFIMNPDRGTTPITTTKKVFEEGPRLPITKLETKSYDVEINGTTKKVEFIYGNTNGTTYEGLEDVMIYSESHLIITIDGIQVNEEFVINYNFQENKVEYDELDEDNINVIKGTDQEYLVFEIYEDEPFITGTTNLYVYNDVAQLINSIKFDSAQTLSFRNHQRRYRYSRNDYHYVIEGDKIYYMDTKLDGLENREEYICNYAREFEFTIVDGKPVNKALELIQVDLAGTC